MALEKTIWRDMFFSRLSVKTSIPEIHQKPAIYFLVWFMIFFLNATFFTINEHVNHGYRNPSLKCWCRFTAGRVGESTTWSTNSTVSAICIKESYHLVIEHNRALDLEWECICSGYINIQRSLSLFRVREYDTFKL